MSKIPTDEEIRTRALKESGPFDVRVKGFVKAAFETGAEWAIGQIKPKWRTDDPTRHGDADRRVFCALKTFKGVMAAIPAKQFKLSLYEQWRELIPGIDYPENDF